MENVGSVLQAVLSKVGAITRKPGEDPTVALLRQGFQAEQVWGRAKALAKDPADAHKIMRLAAWLFATGVRNHDALAHLMAEHVRLRPRSPYAYFAPGGVARESIVQRFHGDRAAAEGQRFKRADSDLFGGRL
jgi:hypothetical protein